MGLHDVDKSSDLRGNPAPNVSDQIKARMAHATFAITLVDAASDVSARVALVDGVIEVRKNDDSLLFRGGLRPSDSEGAVDMAKPGQAL